MNNKNLIVICITIIICLLLISTTAIILKNEDNNQNNNPLLNINQNQASSNSYSNTINYIYWVEFYADGNPNTGEDVTIYVGPEYSGQNVEISLSFSRDGKYLDPGSYNWYTVSADGSIYIHTTKAMSRYPDKCVINLRHNEQQISSTAYLGTHKGTQKITF